MIYKLKILTKSVSLMSIGFHNTHCLKTVKINRPIIFKLAGNNKQMIMLSLKNLRRYNETRLEESSKANKVYVTERLPKPLYQQKKQLLPHYKKARSENKRASWCIQDGGYCLYVDGKKIIA